MAQFAYPEIGPQEGERCGRRACNKKKPRWFNPHTGKWYCDGCAIAINELLSGPDKLRRYNV